jgi:CheY-like chemotaxis protein
VFEPFSTTKQRGEGSGLGLAICKRIVDELGGQISMTSDRGQGSTVRIELPRANREPDTIDHALSVLDGWSPDEAPKLRVLIVDDEVNIVTTLQRVLEQYDVAIALDAKQALAMLDTAGCFDVILCDLMMPGISGPHFYDHACRLSPTLRARFVFMTGGSFSADTREFLQRHRCPVLSKPFTIADVCTAIHQVAGTLSDPLTANR